AEIRFDSDEGFGRGLRTRRRRRETRRRDDPDLHGPPERAREPTTPHGGTIGPNAFPFKALSWSGGGFKESPQRRKGQDYAVFAPLGRVSTGRCTKAANQARTKQSFSIPVVVGFEGALGLDADVVGLLVGELGELGADPGEVEGGNLLVEMLGQDVD